MRHHHPHHPHRHHPRHHPHHHPRHHPHHHPHLHHHKHCLEHLPGEQPPSSQAAFHSYSPLPVREVLRLHYQRHHCEQDVNRFFCIVIKYWWTRPPLFLLSQPCSYLQCNDDSDNQFEDYKHHYKPLLVVSLICIGNTAYSEVMGRYSGEN